MSIRTNYNTVLSHAVAREITVSDYKLIPLDTYTDKPVALMEVVKGDTCGRPEIWDKYEKILNEYEPDNHEIKFEERFDFYERAKGAYLIIATGEKAIYANILLKKGVVK